MKTTDFSQRMINMSLDSFYQGAAYVFELVARGTEQGLAVTEALDCARNALKKTRAEELAKCADCGFLAPLYRGGYCRPCWEACHY